MNKLFTKIAALVLGMTMAVGVGVAVSSGTDASEARAAGGTFEKVTSADGLESGKNYLIVYEDGNLAFDGSLDSFDAVENTNQVTISSSKITTQSDFYFVITSKTNGYSLRGSSEYYTGQTSDANGMKTSANDEYTNSISFDSNGNVNIVSGGAYLRYNSASNQLRFRYYKSSSYTNQKAIQLYKESGSTPPTPSTYTVKYDANGGTGTMTDAKSPYDPGATVKTLTNTFTRDSYTFDHWDTAADDSGTDYDEGDTFTINANTTLYAQWTLNTEHQGTENDPYSVADAIAVIDAGITAENVYATGIVSEIVTAYNPQYGNISYNISADGTTASAQLQAYRGKSYNGDNFTSADDIQVGDVVVVKGNLIKYGSTYEFAQNNELVSLHRECTLTYDANGGTGTMTDPDSPYNAGATVTALANTFTRDSYTFDHWNTAADDSGTDYDEGATFTINANTTLYAQWEEIVEPSHWVLTTLGELTSSDIFVIVSTNSNGDSYTMSNDKGTTSAPVATKVTVSGGEYLKDDEITDIMKWNIGGNATDGYTFYPNGSTDTWLYCTNSNNGVRVGENNDKTFKIDSASGYLKHQGTSRFIGVYDNSDWRCYSDTSGNIANQTFSFFKYDDLLPKIKVECSKTTLAVNEETSVTVTKLHGAQGSFFIEILEQKNNVQIGQPTISEDLITAVYPITGKFGGTCTLSFDLFYTEQEIEAVTIDFTITKVTTKIELSGEYQTSFYEGETFNHEGIVVTATYDDTTTGDVTSEAEFSTPNMTQLGNQTVTVTFDEKQASYTITISERAVDSIEVATLPTKSEYYVGQSLNTAGLTLTVNYETGDPAVVDSGYTISPSDYVFTNDDLTAGSKGFTVTYKTKTNTFSVSIINSPIPSSVDDTLTRETTGVTGSSYTDWSGKKVSTDAVYKGNSAGGNSSIQLRSSNSTSGIVSTSTAGKITKVKVVWNSNTQNGRTLGVYGNNTAYTAASDLYNTSKRGTLLGTIVCGTSTELIIEGDYEYVGVRSQGDAMYLTSITFTWTTTTPAPTEQEIVSGTFDYNDKASLYVGDAGKMVVKAPEGYTQLEVTVESEDYLVVGSATYDSTSKTASFDFIVGDTDFADFDLTFGWTSNDNTKYMVLRAAIQIVNPTGLDAARAFAKDINDCCGQGDDMADLWKLVADDWADLSEAAKSLLINAHYDVTGTGEQTVVTKHDDTHYELANAMSRYDFMVEHYGMTNFMNKSGLSTGGRVVINPFVSMGENSNMVAIVVIVSVVSLTAIGGYFFLKKRREQN